MRVNSLSRDRVSSLVFLIVLITIASFMPSFPIDPWGVFVPKRLLTVFILIAGLQFVGFWLAETIGKKRGALMIGFLGGFVSSTAVHISTAKKASKSQTVHPEMLGEAWLSTASSFLLMTVIVFASAKDIFFKIAPASYAIIITLFLLSIIALKPGTNILDKEPPKTKKASPLNFLEAFKLAILIVLLLSIIGIAKNTLGDEAVYALAFLTGLFELHSMAASLSGLFATDGLSVHAAKTAVLLAAAASILSKSILTASIAKNKYGLTVAFGYLLSSLLGALFYWIA